MRHRQEIVHYPSRFVTIAPDEGKVLRHVAMFGIYDSAAALSYTTGPLCLHIDCVFKKLLLNVLSDHFEAIYEWVLRVEFQGRGTLHVHMAMWAALKKDYDVVGRTGESHT